MTAETTIKGLYIGTAGWQLPKEFRTSTPGTTGLARYSALFNAVEINSTHYKHHMAGTFLRWAGSVPAEFRFAVKMHRSITHVQRLSQIGPAQEFLREVSALGDKLGPVLIQLPPSLSYQAEHGGFLHALREVFDGTMVVEPRHPSWATAAVARVLKSACVGLVAADPPLITDALRPGGHKDIAYFRLHGNPKVYWSPYAEETLLLVVKEVSVRLVEGAEVWVVFDNTAAGAAAPNALLMNELIRREHR